MELTPKVFDDVEFRERFRGYDPDEVDAFLEQVSKGAQELDQKLKEALDRAEKAEARAREAGDADEALRRTLVLAQRTADAAVAEAEQRAAALISEAEGKAASTQAEAESHASSARDEADAYASRTREQADAEAQAKIVEAETVAADMVAKAEREAREGAEDLRQRLRTEVSALEALREHLRTDAGRLEAHIAIQRQRVLATVETLQRLSTDPDALREAPVPEFQPVESPPTAEAMGNPPAPPAPPPPVHAADDVETADGEVAEVEVAAAEVAEAEVAQVEVAEVAEVEVAEVEVAEVEVAELADSDAAVADDPAVDTPAETTGTPVTTAEQIDIFELSPEDEITGEFPAIVIEDLEAADRQVANGVEKAAEAHEATAIEWASETADDDGGPPTMQVPATELLDDDDPYIAELRRAIVDPAPLGPRDDFEPDEAMADFYNREMEDGRWKGFRRRR